MKCDEALPLLSAAAMGDFEDFGAQKKADFEAHLQGCTSCQDEFSLTLQALNMAKSIALTPPETLKRKIQSNGRQEIIRQQATRNRWRYVVSLSTAAAAFLFGIVIFFHKTPGPNSKVNIPATEPHPTAVAQIPIQKKDTQNWTFVDGDSGNTRQSDVKVLPVPEKVLWKQSVAGRPGAYKPLLYKNLIIIGSSLSKRDYRKGGRIIAFDVSSGEERWRRDFPSGDFYKDRSFPDRCIMNDQLHITDGSQCLVLQLSTGKTIKRFVGPSIHAGWRYLSAVNGNLYGTSRDGHLVFCVSPKDGSVLWQRTLDGEVYVPALNKKRMFIHTRTGSVIALNAASGKTLWQQDGATPVAQATLHARHQHLLVVSRKSKMYSFHTQTGALEWERKERGVFQSGMAMGKDVAYVKAGSLAIRLSNGKTFWENTDAKNGICSSPTLAGKDDEILTSAGQRHGQLNVFGDMGKIVASLDTAASWACDGPIISHGRIFLLGDGRLTAFIQNKQSVE